MAVFRISGKLIKTVIFAFAVVVVVLIVTGNSAPKTKMLQSKTLQKTSSQTPFPDRQKRPSQDRRDRLLQ